MKLDELFRQPHFIRQGSPTPKEGYAPSWRFDDWWEETDDTFRRRIQATLETPHVG
jgi:hypothetical protein